MKYYFILFLVLLCVFFSAKSSYVTQTPCIDVYYSKERTCVWRWFRRRCSYYSVKHEMCCDGYGGLECDIPICGGGAVENSCNVEEGHVRLRDNTVITSSGGTCVEPFTCSNCNAGYFPSADNNGTCSACQEIENCNIPTCTEYENTECEWCVGELERESTGYNMFTGKHDSKQCLRACSWRDGYRCFPGTCTGDMLYPSNCACAPGFTGSNCATVTADNTPTILTQILILEGDGDTSQFIADIPLQDGKFWTNEAQWSTADITASSTYKPEIDAQNVPSYIASYDIGIEDITLTATLSRGGDESKWIIQGNCNYGERCEAAIETDLKHTPWNTILQGGFPAPFRHMDAITFAMSTRNGGLIKYIDREAETEKSYNLAGVTTTNTLELGFDFYPPSHCFETSHACTQDSLTVNDFNKNSQVDVYWNGWTDHDSGIYKYILTLQYLAVKSQDDPALDLMYVVTETTVDVNQLSTTLTFADPGPYAVEITAFDKANNYKLSRRIVLYDDSSVVEKRDPPPKVVQANEYFWINTLSTEIEVSWQGRYINFRHHSLGWLNEVKDNPDISRDLDDTSSKSQRSVDALYNIEGIVRFEIGYTIEFEGYSSFVNFVPIPEEMFSLQKMIYDDVELTDGKRLTYTVRGFDILDEYAEDNITVTIDLSPPVIQNLWLTKGDYVNITVHNLLELNEIAFEWEVYDEHSGLYEIEWRIFDNFTKTDIEHGHSFESLQGGAEQALEQCQDSYTNYPRGFNCYCSPYNGCYHKHYQIKPHITSTGTDGIHSGNDVGVHDYDYFIEVTATNNARLKTVVSRKFTIDVSPPHEGMVQDGIPDEPEVDFQQTLELFAHWDGFFDKESSVWFYMYGFDTECIAAEEFDVRQTNEKIIKTYETSATFTVQEVGKYYVTVVAYNHALGVSKPVCSDGVTIDSTPATVSEVVVKDAVTLNGILKDETTGDVFLLKKNREIEQINAPSQDCIDKAIPISNDNILLMPHRRYMNGTKRCVSLTDCDSFPNLHNDLLSFVTSVSHTIGPFVVDRTKPDFQGNIILSVERYNLESFLVASWDDNAFIDHGDPYPLKYEIAIGTSKTSQDVLPFQDLSTGGSCTSLSPTNCAAISTNLLPWQLHALQTYCVVIKATDSAGMFVLASSEKYQHSAIKASTGIVHDVDTNSETALTDIDDIDYQVDTNQLSARWFGFKHPFESIQFIACIAKATVSNNILTCENANTETTHTFTGLTLEKYQTYSVMVIAETEAGNVTAVSDGVTIVVEGDTIEGISVLDGPLCTNNITDGFNLDASHLSEDKRVKCYDDIEYQSSTNRVQAHWSIPSEKAHYLQDIHWAVEMRAPVADFWVLHKDFEHLITTSNAFEESGLDLTAGRRYRILLKLCAGLFCFNTVKSSGVTVIPNPPIPGSLHISYIKSEKQLNVHVEHFKDPDIEDLTESLDVIDHYEWAFTDNSINAKLLTRWKRADPVISLPEEVTFTIDLEGDIQFTKCWKIAVRGYSKAGHSAIVSINIKNCSDIREIRPSIVIDAAGDHLDQEHTGKSIYLEENAIWSNPDTDYTSYNNILSAVWPTLRHKAYTWAVLSVREEDATTFYEQATDVVLHDPCSHPDSVKCGTTDLGYVNIYFEAAELIHGRRYVVCVHANATNLRHELWTQELPEINACSDGVTVDLTPPSTGDVWIGNHKHILYQTSTSELNVNWNSFIDIEEERYAVHTSGITGYEIAIGTTRGGVDMVSLTNVGLTNYKMFHGVHLQNGHTYFATVKGYDFTGQSSVSFSNGVTVDTTPPVISDSRITVLRRHITSTEYVDVCWTGVFSDMESGILHYSWSIGTQRGYDNIMAYIDTEDECSSTPEDSPLSLTEGHAYIINVKAYNNAGQFSVASSWAFVVDSSEPEAGNVYDGSKQTDTDYIDLDYIETSSSVHARWKGFFDPHTPIKEYFISLGMCKGCEDVKGKQPNGLKEYTELKSLQLAEGIKYFVTITACNTADLCTSASSDGFIVDTTPPVKGYVMDGTRAKDIQYQSALTYIGCKWYGFNDPQSQINKYVWRAGTSKGADDIVTATDCHNLEEAFIFDLPNNLPQNNRIFCTVRAYNNAGKYVESTSNSFLVDATPPVFATPLTLSPVGSTKDGTSVLRSLIRVNWVVNDEESFIYSQYISISSHIGGDFNLSAVQVEGIVRDYTLTGLDLHDGSYYDIKLVSCNGAKLCSESILQNILVDSTPPTRGTFAVNTDHAAMLNRQPGQYMVWTPISISLAWLGFEDAHSEIESYSINIGSQYMGNDLNEIPGVPFVITHNSDAPFHGDGFVQTYTLNTKPLSKYNSVFISISAKNSVGLSSEILHSQFNLLYGGILELVRRCGSHTCYGHCVCASEGKLCTASDGDCIDSSGSGNPNTLIEIRDFIDITFPTEDQSLSRSPINMMLAGKWSLKSVKGKQPLWYDCSVGEGAFDTPQGVFHETDDQVWYAAGRNTECIFTLKRGQSLTEREEYSVFVRAWYDQNTFAVFRSPGLVIYSTPPGVSVLVGRNVKEVIAGDTKDTDFITLDTQVNADWTGKFINTANSLRHYHLYLSTSPGGHDAYTLSTSIPSDVTSYNITGLNLEENTKYFTVVQAYNLAGLHSTAVSDGFMLDLHPPTGGIVMDGHTLVDINASNDSHLVSAFWHGFSDVESGIMSYDFCIGHSTNDDDCNILPISTVGIAMRKTFHSSTEFIPGEILCSKVRARDVVGHVSELVSSNGVTIDTSPPVKISSGSCSGNIVLDNSFENASSFVCDDIHDHGWHSLNDKCLKLSRSSMAYDGHASVIIQGTIQQSIEVKDNGRYRLTFFTSLVLSDNLHLSAVEGFISINDDKHIFSLYEKPNSDSYAWQKHTFFFDLNETGDIFLSIGTLGDKSAFVVDDVNFELCDNTAVSSDVRGHVNAHTVFVHDWSSVHADWTFNDPETDIVEYLWAIGTVEGGTQLQTFESVGRRSFGRAESLHLEHNTEVFVTVVAVNEAQLRTVSYSNPIYIDLTPPVFRYINDGDVPEEDIDYQDKLTLTSHWDVFDMESDVTGCSWAIGLSPGDSSLQSFTPVNIHLKNASNTFENSPEDTLFITVQCMNGAGLTSTLSSDGVKILQAPPSTESVILELMTTSTTQFLPRGSYHGNSSEIKFRWTGFSANDGVDSFEVQLVGNDVSMTEIVPSTSTGYNYASFTGLNLVDGEYNVSVTAINKIRMQSQRKSETFYLLTEAPRLTGEQIQTSWIQNISKARASWENVFESTHPMFYEVTISLAEVGQGDMVQWQETSQTYIEIPLKQEDLSNNGVLVEVTVRAVSYSGLFVFKHAELYVAA
ncbi:uncharacterized protein LOC123523194 isoform X2 [Mercenaria mercenaria]|uniref:uncharacterized protein LOC123523194 isoform X2 n=1 Tax=Mercenaria mercenaria TaxID=6596 RepID=UPI00234F11CE|nr:uncharacterized protein LOC123523194 isoform X2 [Mercenaria mercenaria]